MLDEFERNNNHGWCTLWKRVMWNVIWFDKELIIDISNCMINFNDQII